MLLPWGQLKQCAFNAEKGHHHLANECEDPDCVVDRVREQSDEDISLSMDLSRVDLVEDGHHDERVEDHREVDRRRCVDGGPLAVVNVQQNIA